MRYTLAIVLTLCVSLFAAAQDTTFHIEGTFPYASDSLTLYATHEEGTAPDLIVLQYDGRHFSGDIKHSPSGIYHFFAYGDSKQYHLPIYVAPEHTKATLDIRKDGNVLTLRKPDVNNQALNDYSHIDVDLQKTIWELGRSITADDFESHIGLFGTKADSLIAAVGTLNANVIDNIRLTALFSAFGTYNSMITNTRFYPNLVNVRHTFWQMSGASRRQLDNLTAINNPNFCPCVTSLLPNGTLTERIAALYNTYKNDSIRHAVTAYLTDQFLTNFNYRSQFAQGRQELQKAITDWHLDQDLLRRFDSHSVAIKGSPLPEGILLKNAQGETVDLATYRGYYLYIDLWASWCVPCIKESKQLQKLEEELHNPQVKIISISLDSRESDWKNKMHELGAHGIQLWNPDNSLANALNIQSIPHFLIYDKEGRLLQFTAPRPSHRDTIIPLLNSLQ